MRLRLLFVALLASVLACVRAPAPTMTVTKAPSAPIDVCASADVGRERLYLANLPSQTVSALMTSAAQGVVTLKKICGRFEIHEKCHAAPAYGRIAQLPSRKKVTLDDASEIEVNAPPGAAVAPMTLHLVYTGRLSALFEAVSYGDVDGIGCKGATHFVRYIWLGASARKENDATLDACAVPIEGELESLTEPKVGCRSPLAIEIAPFSNRSFRFAATGEEYPCVEPYVWRDEKCAMPNPDLAHACRMSDKKEGCDAQCAAGDMASCGMSGHLRLRYKEPDLGAAAAMPFLERGCDGGDIAACRDVSKVLQFATYSNKWPLRIASLAMNDCAKGDAGACNELGFFHYAGVVGIPRDDVRSAAFYERACDAGITAGCINAAGHWANAPGGTHRAHKLYRRACKAGDWTACDKSGGV